MMMTNPAVGPLCRLTPWLFQPLSHRALGLLLLAGLGIGLRDGVMSSRAIAAESLNEEQLYQLCSRFPYNSRCEGYVAPVALKTRSGQEGRCTLTLEGTAKTENCKFMLDQNSLTVYYEVGEGLTVLEGQKSTRSLTLKTDQLRALSAREEINHKTGERVAKTLLFGVSGLFMTQSEKLLEISLDYNPVATEGTEVTESGSTESGSAESGSAESELTESLETPTAVLKILTEREWGFDLKRQLEQASGLTATLAEP